LTVSPAVSRAEGFFVLSGREMVGRPLDWFTVRQHLPTMSSTEAERRPLVSVVVRTRDRPRPLREALASILAQTYANLEVVVVNAGSEDVSPIVAEFESFLPIRLLSCPAPLGRAAAATWGAKEARGKYLNFLDDDDLLYSDHIEKLASFLEMTGVRVAYSDCERGRYEWQDGGIRLVGGPMPFCGVDYDRDRLFCANYIPFMSALFERTLAEEVGYFDDSLDVLEDWDFWLRASRSTDFYRGPGVTSLYRCFVERPHSNGLEAIYSRHSDEWKQLFDSVGKRIHTLQLENLKLDAALASAQSEFKGLRLAELWNTVRELSILPLKSFGPEPPLPEKKVVPRETQLQSFDDWRAAASEPWVLAESLQRQNQELRGRLSEVERRIRAVRRDPLRMLLGLVPRPLLDAVHRAAQRAAALARRRKPEPPAEAFEPVRDDDKIEIRVYQAGDELRISELFRTCFGVERDVDHWTWKYVDHPWGAKNIAVAVREDGRLLAHYAGYSSHFYDATGDEPRIITGLQIGDTMTAPGARRVGRRSTSLLHQVTRFYFDQFCHEKVDLNFGFNTGKIQSFYTRLIEGSRFFEDVPLMVLDVNDSVIRSLQETASTLANVRVSRVQETDAEWDGFFERHASDYGVLTHRTAEYMRWRYLRRPDVDYYLYAAYQAGCLVGWSVFRQEEERLIWGDGLFGRDRVAAFAAILSHALGLFAHRQSRSAEGWFSSRPDWWARAAAEAGFERRPEPDRIAMIYKPFGIVDLDALFDKSLYYTRGSSGWWRICRWTRTRCSS
jgi:glycosyltransferase involved in cell wall biosynthesis